MTSVSFKNAYNKKITVNASNTKYEDNMLTEDGVLKKGAYMYTRVSLILDKEKQITGESISLDHQDHQITEYCKKNNLIILAKYSDPNVSGKDIDSRKGLQAMFRELRKGIVVVCASVSRLSRNNEDLLCINRTIQEHGAELVLLDMPMSPSTPQGTAFLSLIGTMVQLERQQNNLKISQCMANAAREGKLIKCPKFGYSVVNKLYVEHPEEQKIINYIKLLLEYDSSLTPGPISRELKEKGFVNKKGNPIHVTTIKSILKEINDPTMPQIFEKQKQESEKKNKN